MTVEILEEDFEATLQRVERLALKPHQKADLISIYIIPHFMYSITMAVIPLTTIRRLDQTLRRVVKSIFHLPQCTADGLLYCKTKDGGLGIPRIVTMVVSITLKTGLKFTDSLDPVMRAVAAESKLEQRQREIAKMARLGWPIANSGVIDQYKAREKKKEIARWASLESQGKAVKAFAGNKIANAWLMKPQILKPSKYITALKMRANVAADKVALARAKIRRDIECRKCHIQKETLGHILGQFIHKKRKELRDTTKLRILSWIR
jgi:hypothetical protein